MDAFTRIAEERIEAAIENGELEDLPGAGKPLDLVRDQHVPAELRGAYSILKNAGFLPEEMEQRKEIVRLRDLLDSCDPSEQQQLRARWRAAQLRYEHMLERSPACIQYRDALLARLGHRT